MAGRAPARRRPRLSARARAPREERPPPRRCRGRRDVQGDRRGERSPPEYSGGLEVSRRGGRALWLVRDVRRHRRPDVERAHPRAASLDARTAWAHRRYRSPGVFRLVRWSRLNVRNPDARGLAQCLDAFLDFIPHGTQIHGINSLGLMEGLAKLASPASWNS